MTKEITQTKQEVRDHLSMIGEYSVCAELHKRGIDANITYGNKKAVDIVILNDGRYWKVEVKTSKEKTTPTSFFQKYYDAEKAHPDFWVSVHYDPKTLGTVFYVLTHEEVKREQMIVNKMDKCEHIDGFDKIPYTQLESYKEKWETILNVVNNS